MSEKVDQAYLVVDDKTIHLNPPESGFGKQEITWADGKIIAFDTTSKNKVRKGKCI